MRHSILLFAFIFTISFSTIAQIEGTIINQDKQPVEFANVALYSLPDSIMVTGTESDEKGNFSLNSNSTDNTFLKVSFIGYESQIAPAMKEQIIVMIAESFALGEVVIKGDLPKIRLKNDALVTTVQNSVLSKAGTANDVLKRLPSITGDEGQFSIFGKGQAKIYINNREMRDVSELDNLSSADLKNVEIINNPGARYDGSVKAVIRINTVRKIGDGISLDVRSSYWQSLNTNLTEQLNLNFRKNGWDIFGTFTYHRNASIQDSKLLQNTYVDTLWTQENTLYMDALSHTFGGVAGVNYEFSPNHYIGMKYTHTVYPYNTSSTEVKSIVLADDSFYDKWSSVEKMKLNSEPSYRYNAYYNGDIADLKVDFNADFYKSRSTSESFVSETSQEYDDRKVNSMNSVNNRLIAAKLVLSYPVLGGQITAGSEYTDTDRDDEYINEQNIVPSSNSSIKEQNNSFFTEYYRSSPIGQFGVGLRYEKVRSDYFDNNIIVGEQSRRNDQWFPNFTINTKLKDIYLQLSYTAKTKRPSYRELSSNVFYGNRFTLQTGNPYLRPTTIHDATLIGAWKFLQLMMSYKNENNTVIYWAEQLKENSAVTMVAYRNLEKLPSLATFITVSPTFGFWSPQASVGIVKQWLTIKTNDIPIALNKHLLSYSLNNSFSLPKDFLLSLDMRFRGKGNFQNIYLSKNEFIVNIGLTKSFFNKQWDVSIKGHDIFRGRKDSDLLYNDQMNLLQISRFDSRKLELTVRYKFNSAKSKYKGMGAGQKEINRL